MARPSSTGAMTIAQLENALNNRRAQLNLLMKDRNRAQQKLDTIERQISRLAGRGMGNVAGAGGGGGRVRNAASLVATMENILKSAGKPMPVGDITDAVHTAEVLTGDRGARALGRECQREASGIMERDWATIVALAAELVEAPTGVLDGQRVREAVRRADETRGR